MSIMAHYHGNPSMPSAARVHFTTERDETRSGSEDEQRVKRSRVTLQDILSENDESESPLNTAKTETMDANEVLDFTEPALDMDTGIEGSENEHNDTTTELNWTKQAQPKLMSNAQLIDYARRRGLPEPMFVWDPRFNELPNETIDLILSFADYQVTRKHRKSPYGGNELLSGQTHLFNTIALVSQRLKNVVEKHCEILLKKRAGNLGVARGTRTHSTHRGAWFGHIKNRCAFCHKTAEEVKHYYEQSMSHANHVNGEDYTIASNIDDLERMKTLAGSPFEHNILCCGRCEAIEWPNQILLERAVETFKLPESLLLFPPNGLKLRTGKKDKGYHNEQTWRWQNLKQRADSQSAAISFLEAEVIALRDLIVSDPAKHVPAWMPLPECCTQKEEVPEDDASSKLSPKMVKLLAMLGFESLDTLNEQDRAMVDQVMTEWSHDDDSDDDD